MIELIVGIAVGIGTYAALTHWDELINWFTNFVSKLTKAFLTVAQGVTHAAAVFMQVMSDGLAGVEHKLYYKENNQYIEKTTVRTIPAEELPPWAKAKLNSTAEVDVTRDFEAELQMKIS